MAEGRSASVRQQADARLIEPGSRALDHRPCLAEIAGAAEGLASPRTDENIARQAHDAFRDEAALRIFRRLWRSARADGQQRPVDEALRRAADELPPDRRALHVARHEQKPSVRQLCRVVLMRADARKDIVRPRKAPAVGTMEEEGLDLIEIRFAGKHGVARCTFAACAPWRAVEAGKHEKRTVAQAAQPPEIDGAALQQTGRFRPGAAAVRAFPDGNIVAPAGARGVDAAHVQPDQPPVGKARVQKRAFGQRAPARLVPMFPAVVGGHIDALRDGIRTAAFRRAIGHRRADGLAHFQSRRHKGRVMRSADLLKGQAKPPVLIVEAVRPRRKAQGVRRLVDHAVLGIRRVRDQRYVHHTASFRVSQAGRRFPFHRPAARR